MLGLTLCCLLFVACSGEADSVDQSATSQVEETSVVEETPVEEAPAVIDSTALLAEQAMAAEEEAAQKKAEEEQAAAKKEEEEAEKRRERRKRRPKVKFKTMTHDYGTIMQGDKVEYQFRFTNTGKRDLVIKEATATCGCTRPSYPFIPIPPGEEGYIGVVFDSKGKLGKQKPAITIVTNARPRTYKLYLDGFVDAERQGEQKEKTEEEGAPE